MQPSTQAAAAGLGGVAIKITSHIENMASKATAIFTNLLFNPMVAII
jgi:hypothetical protein